MIKGSVELNTSLPQRTVEGVTYTYPPPDLEFTDTQVEAICALSASHAKPPIIMLDPDREQYPAMGALSAESPTEDPDLMTNLGSVLHKKFGQTVEDVLKDRPTVKALEAVGSHLEAGGNVDHALPHDSLQNIGLTHGLAVIALKRLGVEFKSSVVISVGVTGLGYDLHGACLPLVNLLGVACDKIALTIPRTDNMKKSDFAKAVPPEQIDGLTRIIVAGMKKDQDAGGWLRTLLPDGTSYAKEENGNYRLANPGKGTLRVMRHPKTKVQVAVSRFPEQDSPEAPAYRVVGDLRKFSRFGPIRSRQGDAMMSGMADAMNAMEPGKKFVYLPK